MSDLKQAHEEPDEQHIEDLELTDKDAGEVGGGGTVLVSNLDKTQHDIEQAIIKNIVP